MQTHDDELPLKLNLVAQPILTLGSTTFFRQCRTNIESFFHFKSCLNRFEDKIDLLNKLLTQLTTPHAFVPSLNRLYINDSNWNNVTFPSIITHHKFSPAADKNFLLLPTEHQHTALKFRKPIRIYESFIFPPRPPPSSTVR